MKRSIIIISFLAAIAVLTFVVMMRYRASSDIDLKIPAGTIITKVILQKEGKRVVLEEKKGTWYLNGSEETRIAAVDFMLTVIEDMEPKSPVSEGVFNSLTDKLTGGAVSVKIFSGRRQIRSFTVYHYSDVNYNSIFRKKKTSTPFLFYLPGFGLDAGSVFIADEDYWRPFTIFKMMPSEIKRVTVDYPSDNLKSFSISNDGGKVSMNDNYSFDTLFVKRYLSYFVNVPFETFNTTLKPFDEDKVKAMTPYVVITVTTTKDVSHKLMGWKRISVDGKGVEPDTDRLWGRLDDGKLFVMRYFDIDPLLKKRSYFQPAK
jgi:hypothetical protein